MQNAECRTAARVSAAAAAEVESMLVIKFGGTELLSAKTVL